MRDDPHTVQPVAGGLSADPSRQAVASLGGYLYQAWHSLLEWLDLDEAEALELEGNEDIDRFRPGKATTTQVKNLDPARALTLRSPEIVEAVNNYWAARHRNPGVRLRFRFLSTAGAGKEAGNPFGDRKGLDVWRSARRRADPGADLRHAAQIGAFLYGLDGVSASLKGWLAASTPDQVLSGLIGPFGWDLGAGGTPEVRGVIEEKLVLLGQPYGVLPTNARRAVPGLLDRVLGTAASKSGRFLRRVDLLDAFESITAVTVPVGSYGATAARASLLPAVAGLASALGPQAGGSAYSVAHASLRDGLPDLPTTVLPRPGLQGKVAASMAAGFAHLHGSTGMGKSTTAVFLARRLAEPPLWLDLRAAGQHAPALVRAAVASMPQGRAGHGLILDDADFEGDSRPLQDAIAYAASAVLALGGSLLVTGATELPAPLRLRLRLPETCQHAMPELDEEEVGELLAEHGLADEQARRRWAIFIRAQTNGHPQLVDARVQALRDRGFPGLTGDDLLSGVPPEMGEIRGEARKLIGRLPDQKRDLLYRLSLRSMSFSRDAALRIGGLTPPVVPAGDAFDGLVGPWVERVPGKRFRVSPLALDAGRNALGDDWATEAHARIADLLLHGKLDQFDLAGICVHAVLGSNSGAMVQVCTAIVMNAERLGPPDGVLDLLLYLDPNDGAASLAPTPEARAMLRMAQVEVAVREGNGPRALSAAQALEAETRVPPERTVRQRTLRFLALGVVLRRTGVPLGPAFVVRSTAELSELQEETEELRDAVGELPEGVLTGMRGQADLGWMLLAFLWQRLNSAEDLDSFWQALESLDPARRGTLFAPLSADAAKAQYLPDAAWLATMRSDQPDWARLAGALCDGYTRALAWGTPAFAAVVAATAVRTLNENLARRHDAFAFGRRAIRSAGWDARLVDAVADVCDSVGRPRAAHRLRRRVVGAWLPSEADRLGPAIARRKAARSAANAGDWSAARTYLEEAAAFLEGDQDQAVFRTGLIADAGHAAARAGDKPAAVGLLVGARGLLRAIPNDPGQPRAFRLHKLFGNLTAWLAEGTKVGPDGFGIREQPPAACSDFEVAEGTTTLPATPLEFSAVNLCRYAGELLADYPTLRVDLERLLASPVPALRIFADQVAVQVAVDEGNMAEIARRSIQATRTVVHLHERGYGPGSPDLEVSTPHAQPIPGEGIAKLIETPILSCLLRQLDRTRSLAVPADWLSGMERTGLPDGLQRWLGLVSGAGRLDTAERWAAYQDARRVGSRFAAALYAISLSDDDSAHTAQLVHAHLDLFHNLWQGTLESAVAPSASRIFARQWAAIAAQPFRLRDPTLTAPVLRGALASGVDGLGKAARILRAGMSALGIGVPPEVAAAFRDAEEDV